MKLRRVMVLWAGMMLAAAAVSATTFTEDAMKYPVGVRALGMGGAATALADDVAAIYYNPAGLSKQVFSYSFNDMDIDRRNLSMNTAHMLNIGPVGFLSHQYNTATNNADITMFAYGARGARGVAWGFSLKNLRRSIAPPCSWSSDLSLLLQLDPRWSVGLNFRDLVKDRDSEIPTSLRLGLAGKFFGGGLLVAADAESRFAGGGGVESFWGAEFGVMKDLQLRAGINRGMYTAGATFALPIGRLHYAANFGQGRSDFTNLFSFELGIIPRKDRIASIMGPTEVFSLSIGGDIQGGEDQFSLLGGRKRGLDEMLAEIRQAAKDNGIGVILVRIQDLGSGLADTALIQEIRQELAKAQKSNKKVVAFIEDSSTGDEYYLASVADKVIAPPQAWVGQIGKGVSVIRTKKLLDKLGVDWIVMTKGKFKDSFSPYRSSFTKDQQEEAAAIIEDIFRQIANDIGASRKIPVSQLKSYADGLPISAERAKQLNLIDEIGFLPDAKALCAKLLGQKGDPKLVSSADLTSEFEYEGMVVPWVPKVALIEIEGDITTGKSGDNLLMGGRWVGADTVVEQLKSARDNPFVRAIIVRINSPGGSTIASNQIYKTLMDIRRDKENKKVVVASLGDVAASGGYYIAAAADKIVADPSTITGSIGIIGEIPVFKKLMDKVGVGVDTVKEGEHIDMFSGYRRLTWKEKEWMYREFDEAYKLFLKSVADGRGMEIKDVQKLAEGRIYTGNQAKENKLVDEIGNLSTAIEVAKRLTNTTRDVEIIYYRRDMPWFEGNGMNQINLGGWLSKPPGESFKQYRLPGF